MSPTLFPAAVTATSANGSQVSSAVAFAVNNQPYREAIPSFGKVSFTASPNPMTAASNGLGQTTLSYSSYSSNVEIHVGSPDGPMVMASGPSGSVTNGTTFFLHVNLDSLCAPLTCGLRY